MSFLNADIERVRALVDFQEVVNVNYQVALALMFDRQAGLVAIRAVGPDQKPGRKLTRPDPLFQLSFQIIVGLGELGLFAVLFQEAHQNGISSLNWSPVSR